jgi:tetratricopeptide (TPR) repeat protein
MLWWPFSCHPVWREKSLIPTTPLKEAILFGFPSLLVVIIRYAISSYQILSPDSQTSSQTSRQELFLWCVNITTTAILLGIAAMTNHLRQTREAQLERARQSSHVNHRYKETLLLLNEAERWPSTAKPGRIDYLRGWTYSQLGDRKQAEDYYLRSLRADPSYFWAVADLAYFYASAPERREVRQSKVKPYLNRLQEEFVHHPHLSETLDTITRALEHPR